MESKNIEELYNSTYFKINKVLLIFTGLWPYKSRNEKLFRRIIVSAVMFLTLLPNANAVRIWCGVDFYLCGENIVASFYSLVIIVKYFGNILSESKIIKVHKYIAKNWATINDPDERSILIDYAKQGKIMSLIYLVYMVLAGIAFSQITLVPVILDWIFPLNKSRDKILIIQGEYYFDPFEYYYELYVAYGIAAIVSVSVLISIDTAYTVVVHQNLGMFSIVKFRSHNITHDCKNNNNESYAEIVKTIQLHIAALQFVDLIESSYSSSFIMIFFIFVSSLSTGTALFVYYLNDFFQIVRMSMVFMGILIHMFYLTYPGQKILDYTTETFSDVYMNEWYILPEKAKTLIKIMMLRCLKSSVLTAGKFYALNYQNYGNVIKTTMSYATVLASFKEV